MTDAELILSELKQGSITSDQMWRRHGVQRTGARIYDLRKQGHIIETVKRRVHAARGCDSMIAEYHLRRK